MDSEDHITAHAPEYDSPADVSKKWQNRRQMAYISLFSMFVVTYWAMFYIPESRLKILDDVITWFYFVNGSIVASYVGFSTFESIKGGKIKR